MKIICIGRNYHDHISELKNKITNEPLFFLKPDTATQTQMIFIINYQIFFLV
jgi:2-keto-4-pentenoate hydratase/2-oxohepta-3-ene-1,7-dioic acid hydratase in catechol pathway